MTMVMTIVSKSKLKAKMLEFFRHVQKTGEELIVTDNNQPVLKVIPIHKKVSPDEIFSDIRGQVKYKEDLLKDTSKEWGDLK